MNAVRQQHQSGIESPQTFHCTHVGRQQSKARHISGIPIVSGVGKRWTGMRTGGVDPAVFQAQKVNK